MKPIYVIVLFVSILLTGCSSDGEDISDEVIVLDEVEITDIPIEPDFPAQQLVRTIDCLSDSTIKYDRGAGPENVGITISTQDGNFYSSPDKCAVTPQSGQTTLKFQADFSYSFYAAGPYGSTEPVPVTGLLIEEAEILSVLYIEMRGNHPFQYSLHGSEYIIDAVEEDGEYVAKAETESIILYDSVEVRLTRLSAVISTGQEASFGNITRQVELIFAPA